MATEQKKLPQEEGPSPAEHLVKKLDPITKLIGYAIAIIATGFTAGVYYRGNQADLEKMRMDQECNARIQKLEMSLSDAKRDKTESALESLNQVVKQLQQQQNGK